MQGQRERQARHTASMDSSAGDEASILARLLRGAGCKGQSSARRSSKREEEVTGALMAMTDKGERWSTEMKGGEDERAESRP